MTDASLPHIRSLEKLRKVYLNGTKVSKAAAEALKTARPGLVVAQ